MKDLDKITLTVGQLKRLIKESNEYSEFEIKDGVLVKYHGKDKDVVIPDGVETIGEYAFSGRIGLTSVVIPDSVMKIERFAFNSCPNLISVSRPDGVTVEYGAFGNCPKLKTTNIQRRKRSLAFKTEAIDNEDYLFKIFEGALEHEFVMMFEDGQFDGWSRQKIIKYEYKNVWQTVQEWCEFYDKSVDFQTVKQVALSRLGGEEGIRKYIENKVDDFIENEVLY